MQKQISILKVLGALCTSMILTVQVYAQQFQGIATYQSDRDMSHFEFSGDNMTPEMVDQMKSQLKKQFQREYELRFNLTESTWQEAESLDGGPATASSGGMVMTISFGSNILYKNTESKQTIQQTESFSKVYLIEDTLENRAWKMTGNTKKIGNYTAMEAVYEDISESVMMSFSDGDDEETTETVMDTTLITAWYTPEIPVSTGPDDTWGLPGLILEMTDGSVTYLCTKVVLNPSDKLEIKAPTKGKKMTAEEFAKEQEERTQEMMERMSSGSGDGEETMTFTIRN